MAGRPYRNSPKRFHGIVSAVLALTLACASWWLLGQRLTWPYLLFSWLAAINLVAFLYYGYDKARARQGASRVPEIVLHGLAAVGGSPGAWAGMQLFRHKTVKGPFRILFWLIVLLQGLLLVWLIKAVWFS